MHSETYLKRLQWRCRRGMLELDLLFVPFVAQHLPLLDDGQMQALDVLLNMTDPQLWQLLQTPSQAANSAQQDLLSLLSGMNNRQPSCQPSQL